MNRSSFGIIVMSTMIVPNFADSREVDKPLIFTYTTPVKENNR
jgi:hypothetical protein